SELVPYLRRLDRADAHFDQPVAARTFSDEHGIDLALLAALERERALPLLLLDSAEDGYLLEEPRRRRLANEHVLAVHLALGHHYAVLGEVLVRLFAPVPDYLCGRQLNLVLLAAGIHALLCLVRLEHRHAVQAPVESRAIHYDRVGHVVAVVAREGDDAVLARGLLLEVECAVHAGLHHRLLRIIHYVCPGVVARAEIGRVYAEGLLRHRAGHRNPR